MLTSAFPENHAECFLPSEGLPHPSPDIPDDLFRLSSRFPQKEQQDPLAESSSRRKRLPPHFCRGQGSKQRRMAEIFSKNWRVFPQAVCLYWVKQKVGHRDRGTSTDREFSEFLCETHAFRCGDLSLRRTVLRLTQKTAFRRIAICQPQKEPFMMVNRRKPCEKLHEALLGAIPFPLASRQHHWRPRKKSTEARLKSRKKLQIFQIFRLH